MTLWLKKRFNSLRHELGIILLSNNNNNVKRKDVPCAFINIKNDLKGNYFIHKSEKNAYRDYSRYRSYEMERSFLDNNNFKSSTKLSTPSSVSSSSASALYNCEHKKTNVS